MLSTELNGKEKFVNKAELCFFLFEFRPTSRLNLVRYYCFGENWDYETIYALEVPYIAYSVDSMRTLNISVVNTSMRVWLGWTSSLYK